MKLITSLPRGTRDILPEECKKWQYIEDVIRKTAQSFNLNEVRFPTFEHRALFEHGVGDNTDVVQKEMYTFFDKGGREITLRPEGTSGVVRLVLENGLFAQSLPQKLYYLISCFRYEKPQAGRLREFHQFGIEFFGASDPSADAEIISCAKTIFDNLKIKNLSLEINSIGCKECREKYYNALREYFSSYSDDLCETCNSRLQKNPMRILDCKSQICSKIADNAPKILDYICDDCKNHFEGVKELLDIMNIKYTVNPHIVRGLDYYSGTVFEFVSNEIGAQGTVCGGGRYDGLSQIIGDQALAGIGFAMGLERILLLMEAQGIEFDTQPKSDIYFAYIGEKGKNEAIKQTLVLRRLGFSAETDIVGRGLKAQMKYADKINARYTVVLGDNEVEAQKAVIKDMQSGEKTEIEIEKIIEFLK
ncbi:MAG: histidine--tRNA ligase [Ruminococcaceae bacterium]|nr:histidine--tRNA ligase [Oscillospiraceae bacterium]